MKNIKYLLITLVLTIASVTMAKTVLVDKTYLKSLEGHKSSVTQLDLPAGDSSITVEADDENAVISCQFVNSNGIVGLEDKNVGKCWGNVAYKMDDKMSVRITNETDSLVDVRIHQVTTAVK